MRLYILERNVAFLFDTELEIIPKNISNMSFEILKKALYLNIYLVNNILNYRYYGSLRSRRGLLGPKHKMLPVCTYQGQSKL